MINCCVRTLQQVRGGQCNENNLAYQLVRRKDNINEWHDKLIS
jgi:hypothetical protein